MTNLTTEEIIKRYPVGTVLKLTAKVIDHDASMDGAHAVVVFASDIVQTHYWVPQDALAAAEIVSRPVQAGDKVRCSDGETIGVYVVHAVKGDKAWIGDGLDDHTAKLADLELAE